MYVCSTLAWTDLVALLFLCCRDWLVTTYIVMTPDKVKFYGVHHRETKYCSLKNDPTYPSGSNSSFLLGRTIAISKGFTCHGSRQTVLAYRTNGGRIIFNFLETRDSLTPVLHAPHESFSRLFRPAGPHRLSWYVF